MNLVVFCLARCLFPAQLLPMRSDGLENLPRFCSLPTPAGSVSSGSCAQAWGGNPIGVDVAARAPRQLQQNMLLANVGVESIYGGPGVLGRCWVNPAAAGPAFASLVCVLWQLRSCPRREKSSQGTEIPGRATSLGVASLGCPAGSP